MITNEISEENRSLMQWMDLQPQCSVLYIAFGTLVRNELEQFQEITFVLESTKQSEINVEAHNFEHSPKKRNFTCSI